MLKPQITPTRELVSLDGLWNFALGSGDLVKDQPWSARLTGGIEVPVPASYNDIFVDQDIRNHVGWVYYQTYPRIPRGWKGERVFIRVDAATHAGRVYVNETLVAQHVGGYTPFEADITHLVSAGKSFRLTIMVNNELTNETIPPGSIEVLANGKRKQTYYHDFYNYAGLARSVWLYCVPRQHVQDISVMTDVKDGSGIISYDVETAEPVPDGQVHVSVIDENGVIAAETRGHHNQLTIDSVKLWQPGAAYLYQLQVEIYDAGSQLVDTYSISTGIRTVEVRGMQFLINGKPFYFTGFGKHEDTAVRGKGHDPAYMVHDFQLMNWIGANSFRTSHYPYAEEVMDFADRHGIVVIDETAAVGLNLGILSGLAGGVSVPTFSPDTINDKTQAAHAQAIRELIARDKNHPCVILWSISNEPGSSEDGSREYFEPLVRLTRQLDPSRPVCFVNVMFAPFDKDLISDLFDVLCLNRYYGWYREMGDLETAEVKLEEELLGWQNKYGKPMIMTEYGADTLTGLHAIHDLPWSEEYQGRLLDVYHRVHDRVVGIVGEQVWNFADFQTAIQIFRVDGNKKGVFTRDRKPKAAAHSLRARWVKRLAPEKI